jgi:hypothetical protein
MEETLPDWRDKFLSYKDLKKQLKLIYPKEGDKPLNKRPRLDDDQMESGEAEKEVIDFVRVLEDEMEKFNSFIVEKEEDYVIKWKVYIFAYLNFNFDLVFIFVVHVCLFGLGLFLIDITCLFFILFFNINMSSVIEFLVEKIFFFTVFMKLLVSIWKEEEEEEEKKRKERKKVISWNMLPPLQVGPTCVRKRSNLDSGLICMRVISSVLNKLFGFELYL